jgi:diketogulonate reductase-like aldo/keto reductase
MLNPFVRDSIRAPFLRRSVVGHCQTHGIAFVAHSPMGSWWNVGLEAHPVLRPIAARRGLSAHAVALAWVLAQGQNVVPIPGARRVEHAVEAARAAEVELTPEELHAIDRAAFPCGN